MKKYPNHRPERRIEHTEAPAPLGIRPRLVPIVPHTISRPQPHHQPPTAEPAPIPHRTTTPATATTPHARLNLEQSAINTKPITASPCHQLATPPRFTRSTPPPVHQRHQSVSLRPPAAGRVEPAPCARRHHTAVRADPDPVAGSGPRRARIGVSRAGRPRCGRGELPGRRVTAGTDIACPDDSRATLQYTLERVFFE